MSARAGHSGLGRWASIALLALGAIGCDDDGDLVQRPVESGGAGSHPDAAASGGGSADPDGGGPSAGSGGQAGSVNAGTGTSGGTGASPDPDAAVPAAGSGSLEVPPECDGLLPDTLPEELVCTGLYADIHQKTLNAGVREFAPAHELWSDGAEKSRWLYLPEGQTIDGSDPLSWRFPIGTKVWKEFRWNGQRAETRLFWKVDAARWIKTAYRWDADESGATRFAGGMVDVAGDDYYIPSAKECDQCHKGRADRMLGLEAGLLGLPGASGITLASLIDDGLIANNAVPGQLSLGDDGSGMGAGALAWLHVNCGVSCHNDYSASEGYMTDLRLRLTPDQLQGGSLDGAAVHVTGVGVEAKTPRWSDRTIIVPGAPANSLLYALINHRDPLNMKDQMPPIASRVVDAEGVMLIEAWITALGSR